MKLREALQDAMLFQEAYEVLLVELDLVKEPERRPRVPSYWLTRNFNDYLDVPVIVCERVWSYLEKMSSSELGRDSPLIEEAHCHLRLAEAFRSAAFATKDVETEMFLYRQSGFHRKEALLVYEACGSQMGISNVLLFDAKRNGQFDLKDDILTECDRICSLFRDLNSLKGSQETLLWKAEFLHTHFRDPVTESYTHLEQVAHKAGDLYQWHFCRLKKLQWWITSSTLVDNCLLVFRPPRGFVSAKLGSIASLNLSKAYTAFGDYFQAEIAGFFHLLLVSYCDDNDHIYASLMNLLQIQNDLVIELPHHVRQMAFSSWTQGWLQILVNINSRAVELIAMGWRSRTYDIMKMLELALLIPRTGASFNSDLQPQEMGLPPALHVYIPVLNLGMGLLELLPLFFWPIFLDQFGLTLGMVLESSGNYSLALDTYRQSLIANHPGSKNCANKLKLRVGGLLMKLGNLAPNRYRYAEAVAVKAFAQAESFSWANLSTDDGFKDAVWASISLASCALSALSKASSETTDDEDEMAVTQARTSRIMEVCTSAVRRAIGQWYEDHGIKYREYRALFYEGH
jgi:hypothetical protein